MSAILDYWAIANTLVIMLALGMLPPLPIAVPVSTLVRATLLYNIGIPVAALVLIHVSGVFQPGTLIALALCVAAAGGTSGGAFVGIVRGIPMLATRLIIILLIASLLVITLFSKVGWIPLGNFSLLSLGLVLIALTLTPLWTGMALRRIWPTFAAQWQPRLEKLGSLLVILLVVALAIRYGADIFSGPAEPILAGLLLTAIFVLPPLLEPDPSRRRTITLVTLIRNLTLVLSLLAVLPPSSDTLATVLAFGLFMYIAAGLLVLRWRNAV